MKRTQRSLALFIIGFGASFSTASFSQQSPRVIEIHAHRFSFDPSEITLKPGETVTLHLTSDDVAHSLVIPGLNVNQEVSKSHPADVTVTPHSAGDFHGQCGRFCGSGHGSMIFTVHVKE